MQYDSARQGHNACILDAAFQGNQILNDIG